MRAANVQASLRIQVISPEPPLLAHISSESRGTFRQKARFLAPLNGWACAVTICHDGMLKDTNSLDGALITSTWPIAFRYLNNLENLYVDRFRNRIPSDAFYGFNTIVTRLVRSNLTEYS